MHAKRKLAFHIVRKCWKFVWWVVVGGVLKVNLVIGFGLGQAKQFPFRTPERPTSLFVVTARLNLNMSWSLT